MDDSFVFSSADMRFPGALWFEQAFAFAKSPVPADIKEFSRRMCVHLKLADLESPLTVANITARELMRGSGFGEFFTRGRTTQGVRLAQVAPTVTARLHALAPQVAVGFLARLVAQELDDCCGFKPMAALGQKRSVFVPF